MKTSDLDFSYPEELIATSPQKFSRVMWVEDGPEETTLSQLISRLRPEDVVVINETKVLKARVITGKGLEILFVKKLSEEPSGEQRWEVLCPARRWSKEGEVLPGGCRVSLEKTGLPQVLKTERPLDLAYFEAYGDIPLPPYIQEKRRERKSRPGDERDYQTAWGKVMGSLAAPTASLHFKTADIERMKCRGAEIVPLCLHVGLGTFLPIHSENLDDHKMHAEFVSIPKSTLQKIERAQQAGGKVWALGTTVLRGLEAWAHGHLEESEEAHQGETDLFIRPGFEFRVVDRLMTNFHQPQSTLLALVGAFAGLEKVLSCYRWAVEREFRLFSYGDLTVWTRE